MGLGGGRESPRCHSVQGLHGSHGTYGGYSTARGPNQPSPSSRFQAIKSHLKRVRDR